MSKIILTRDNYLKFFPLLDFRLLINDVQRSKCMAYAIKLRNNPIDIVTEIINEGEILKMLNDFIQKQPTFIRSGSEGWIDGNCRKTEVVEFKSKKIQDLNIGDLIYDSFLTDKFGSYVYCHIKSLEIINDEYIGVGTGMGCFMWNSKEYILVGKIGKMSERIKVEIQQDRFWQRAQSLFEQIKNLNNNKSPEISDKLIEKIKDILDDDYAYKNSKHVIESLTREPFQNELKTVIEKIYSEKKQKQQAKIIGSNLSQFIKGENNITSFPKKSRKHL